MNRIASSLLVLMLATGTQAAFAQTAGSGTTTGGATSGSTASASSSTTVTTAAQALKAKDDTDVMMEGTVTKHLKGEKYTFRDASGEVTVDIDDDKWPESKPILNTRVRIHGEVERKLISRRVEVDVDRMEVLK